MDFARPLLKESISDGEHYGYWLAGSCFMVSQANKLFVVTAKHVANAEEANVLRVLAAPPGREFLPISAGYSAIPADQFDSDYADVSAFEIDKSLLSPQTLEAMSILQLDDHECQGMSGIGQGSRLIIKGYPWDLNNIDTEINHINLRAFQASGRLAGDAPMQGCYSLAIDDPSSVDNLNLMSGSAIMLAPEDRQTSTRLAGMAVRGGNGHVYFVDCVRICEFLKGTSKIAKWT